MRKPNRKPLEEPELVTLLEEGEPPPPPISPELKALRKLAVDVGMLIGLKVAMLIVSRRVLKDVRELNKVNIPKQWYRE